MESLMICLDTNFLILGLVSGSMESKKLIRWVQSGEILITPMPAWYEFLCGPVSAIQIATMRAFLHEVIAFGDAQASLAAKLFNATGRKRGLRVDAMIAATSMTANAKLATNNTQDFVAFGPHGLILA
jgi:predicted nucleic acid-binding protein